MQCAQSHIRVYCKSFALSTFFILFSLGLLHACYQTLHSWNSSHPAPPKPWSSTDAEEFLTLAKKDHGDLVTNDDYVTQFAKICAGEVNPMCASVGGVVGQEVMKACSGKFMPIYQPSWHIPEKTNNDWKSNKECSQSAAIH